MNQLGDIMFSLPVLYNLKQSYPEAEISCVSRNPVISELAILNGLIDRALVRPDNIFKKMKIFWPLKKEKIDLALFLSQSVDSSLLGYWLGIPRRIGFVSSPVSFLYTEKVFFAPPPSLTNNLRLLEPLGIKITKTDYTGLLKLTPDKEYLQQLNIGENDFVVVIAPGTSRRRKHKMWSAEKFSIVIKDLLKKYSARCLIAGTKNDYPVCLRIKQMSKSEKVSNLAGQTTLSQISQILSRSNLFLGVDSGLMHLAAALDRPVVGLFGKTRPEIIGPENKNKVIIKKARMEEISPSEVIAGIDRLLS